MCTILGYGLPERETYCILHVYKAFAFSSFYRIPSALPLRSFEDCTVTHTVYIMYEYIVRSGRIWHKKGSLHLCEQPFIQQFNCQPQFQYGNPRDFLFYGLKTYSFRRVKTSGSCILPASKASTFGPFW